jgi:hypothetical protein
MRRLIICTLHQILLGWTGRDKIFWSQNLNERDHEEDLGVDARIMLQMDLRETGWNGVDRIVWLVVGTSGGLL